MGHLLHALLVRVVATVLGKDRGMRIIKNENNKDYSLLIERSQIVIRKVNEVSDAYGSSFIQQNMNNATHKIKQEPSFGLRVAFKDNRAVLSRQASWSLAWK